MNQLRTRGETVITLIIILIFAFSCVALHMLGTVAKKMHPQATKLPKTGDQ